MNQRNVVSEVVKHNLCIGCGLCAGVCPSGNLTMEWNEYGEYNPVEQGHCLENCSLCLNVCPFMDGNDNEDSLGKKLFAATPGIKHTKETGYYLQCYAGYSHNREIGASGGMTSFVLERLLEDGLVDKVVSVSPHNDPDALFQFRVMETPKEIRESTGSAYYPVHLADVVKYILEQEGTYAVTALPCFAKALRLAAEKLPALKKRIKYILGLVCGQLKSSFYTSYIASLAGVDEPLRRCYFREKAPDQPAGNFAFTCEGITGKTGRIRWNEGVSQVWMSRWFTPIACNFCDDVFAEVADAVFMDAWLPGYRENPKGTNLFIVRNKELLSLLQESNQKDINLTPLPVSEIIKSQAGVVHIKRDHLAYRLFQALNKGKKAPKKRVSPSKKTLEPFQRKEIEILDRMQKISRASASKKNIPSNREMEESLHMLSTKLQKIRKQKATILLPIRAVRKMCRIVTSRFYPR
jgi:coenzyme F420-reducing hydrogenase beta subunit